MTVEKTFQKYLEKVEKNGINDNIATDRGKFVNLYNEHQNRYIEWLLDRKGDDDVRYIQKLLIPDKKINPEGKTPEFFKFKLPLNYFDFSNVYAKASKGECKLQKLDLFEIKEENKNLILQDEFNNPSFFYRESPFTINSEALNVFYTDFTIDNIYLSYYRYPKQISLISPDDPESKFDETKGIEFDDKLVDRIITLCAGGFSLNNNDPIFQAEKAEAAQKI